FAISAPIVPEAPVTSATLRSAVRSLMRRSVISSNLAQRLEEQHVHGPTRVVAGNIAVQRVGNRALQQRAPRSGSVNVKFQAVEFAESQRLIQIACARIRVHSINLDQVHHIETV